MWHNVSISWSTQSHWSRIMNIIAIWQTVLWAGPSLLLLLLCECDRPTWRQRNINVLHSDAQHHFVVPTRVVYVHPRETIIRRSRIGKQADHLNWLSAWQPAIMEAVCSSGGRPIHDNRLSRQRTSLLRTHHGLWWNVRCIMEDGRWLHSFECNTESLGSYF